MALVARIQSPTFLNFLYSTRKDWIGKPPFPRGIQVTYTDVSEAMEIVGLSGASGAGETVHEGGRKQEGTGLGDNHSMAPGLGPFLIGPAPPCSPPSCWLHPIFLGPTWVALTLEEPLRPYTSVMSACGGPRVGCSPLQCLWTHRASNPTVRLHCSTEKLQSTFPHCGHLGRCQENIIRTPRPTEPRSHSTCSSEPKAVDLVPFLTAHHPRPSGFLGAYGRGGHGPAGCCSGGWLQGHLSGSAVPCWP